MERFLAALVALTLGLVAFPIVLALVIWGCVKMGVPDTLGMIGSLAAGLAAFVFIVWKGPGRIRNGLKKLRDKSPEPLYSCLAHGFTCALTIGVLMTTPIFLLGHTRPVGWDLDRVPPFVVGAFVLGLILGLPRGAREKSRA